MCQDQLHLRRRQGGSEHKGDEDKIMLRQTISERDFAEFICRHAPLVIHLLSHEPNKIDDEPTREDESRRSEIHLDDTGQPLKLKREHARNEPATGRMGEKLD